MTLAQLETKLQKLEQDLINLRLGIRSGTTDRISDIKLEIQAIRSLIQQSHVAS